MFVRLRRRAFPAQLHFNVPCAVGFAVSIDIDQDQD
jgi:hypothetical protein